MFLESIDLLLIGAMLLSFAFFFLLILLFGNSSANDPTDLGNARRGLVFGPLTHVLAVVFPLQFESKAELKRDLRRAGYYHRHAATEHLAVRNFLLLGWALLVWSIHVLVTENDPDMGMPILIAGFIVGIVLFSVPRLILQAQAGSRLQRIQYSLPDALDMITMMMTGGVPLVKALKHASSELKTTHPDLACELAIVTRQMDAGSLDLALRQFADRIDIPDVQSLAALVSQTERLGANVAAAFRDYSDSVRRSMRQRAEELGNKASVKLLLPVVFCLAPPVYILLLAPALIELSSFVEQGNAPGGVLSQEDIEIPDATTLARPATPRPESNLATTTELGN